MRKLLIRWTTVAVLSTVLLAASSPPVPIAALSVLEVSISAETTLESQAQSWVDELASKSDYSEWKSATLAISPLGPGTHSWLVLLTKKETIVGYLVVNATEDGKFQLGEYGIGEYPLFNEQSLQLSLLQLELINQPNQAEKVYVHPLQAAWRITSKKAVYYRDANSGEDLPEYNINWDKPAGDNELENRHGLLSSHAKLAHYRSIGSFDPYGRMPWLTKKPIAIQSNDYSTIVTAIKNKKQLRYTYVSEDNSYRAVWSVVGYDEWENGELFVALDTDEDSSDRRYIPMALLVEKGKFYR
ncbi:hypothetical protein I6N90_03940 [Paenibacillus sp. GSMTC-2017]|uniref:hypothetical protein n=1 Tax=Paenibacillus sp. GSMTC-2017 TaxID=2794350 RepID=UPI0018D8A1B7|nr:hypothetical protein [Paenibacillus sp. GSMTC-2017]MBH5316956.1 hypothetical protein [Paenibacillus sp. GSMTC-2017]